MTDSEFANDAGDEPGAGGRRDSMRAHRGARLRPGWLPVFSVLLVVVLLRSRGLSRTVWAEDGQVFLGGALRGIGSIFEAYAGYLHVLPRVIAIAASQFSLAYYPHLVVWVSAVVWATCGTVAAVVVARAAGGTWLAWVAGLSVVGMARASAEDIGNLANLQHVMLVATAVLMIDRMPTARWHRVAVVIGVAMSGLSSPLPVAVLPTVLWAGTVRSGERRWPLLLAGVVSGAQAVQFLAFRFGVWTRPGRLGLGELATFMASWVKSLLPVSWVGQPMALPLTGGLAVIVVGLTVVCAVRDRRADQPILMLAVACIGYQILTFPLVKALAPRHLVAPTGIAAVALVLAIAERSQHWPGHVRRAAAVVLVALLLVAGLQEFGPNRWRRSGPSWDDELTLARRSCARGTVDHVDLRVAPAAQLPLGAWGSVAVPCNRID